MTVIRILRTAKTTLTRTFYLDETATNATGTVNVTVTRLDGTIVDGPTAASGPTSNAYSYTFPGRDVLDELIVSWSATVSGDAIILDQDRIQVVGGFYFSLGEGRAIDPKLADQTMFPTQKIIDARTIVEDECERICEQAFVPRFDRVALSGYWQRSLVLPHCNVRAIRAVTITPVGGAPVAFSPTEIAQLGVDPAGVLRRDGGLGYGVGVWDMGLSNIAVEYEHGLDWPPSDIVDGSKIRLKSKLLQPRSPLPDRVDTIGGQQVGQPNLWRTGLPEVDAIYARHPRPSPGFG